eukprot:2489205-Heterocapsa_arctica.AAC.1
MRGRWPCYGPRAPRSRWRRQGTAGSLARSQARGHSVAPEADKAPEVWEWAGPSQQGATETADEPGRAERLAVARVDHWLPH